MNSGAFEKMRASVFEKWLAAGWTIYNLCFLYNLQSKNQFDPSMGPSGDPHDVGSVGGAMDGASRPLMHPCMSAYIEMLYKCPELVVNSAESPTNAAELLANSIVLPGNSAELVNNSIELLDKCPELVTNSNELLAKSAESVIKCTELPAECSALKLAYIELLAAGAEDKVFHAENGLAHICERLAHGNMRVAGVKLLAVGVEDRVAHGEKGLAHTCKRLARDKIQVAGVELLVAGEENKGASTISPVEKILDAGILMI